MKLAGLRVLDLSLFLPGPFATQMMADHGAEVIKLEPLTGEPNREIGEMRDGTSVYFANTHRNKKSIQLNLKTEKGQEVIRRLIKEVDVFVEAFRPGVAKRLGISYEDLYSINPRIVYCSMSAWGQSGPYLTKPAHDLATEAVAGALSITLGPDGNPAIPGIAAADMLSSMMSLSGILMALYRREVTKQGDYIDVAMADSIFASTVNNMGAVFADKKEPDPSVERALGGYAFYKIYKTKDDRHIVLGGSELHFAEALLKEFGRLDLLPYCKPPPGPTQQPVKSFLEETFLSENQEYWIKRLKKIDTAFAPVKTLREAADDDQIRHREMIVEDDRGWEHLGIPIKFKNEPGKLVFSFPEKGEHNSEILRSLGYQQEDLLVMEHSGVFGRKE